MKIIDCIPPDQFSLLATLIGLLLAEVLDLDEQNAVGNFLVSVGQAILTEAAQGSNIKGHQPARNDIYKRIDYLSAQMDDLKRQLRALR